MKKILCCVLVVTLLFCGSYTSMAKSSSNELADALALFGAMGLVDYNEDIGVNLSRAEFAFRVAQFIGVNVYDVDSKNYFSDVIDLHYAKTAINYLAKFNHISGSNGQFRPDDLITPTEAIKILLSLAGYAPEADARGGYPNGYQLTAARLKISNGINISDNLTAGDCWVLLYRICQLNYLEATAIKGDSILYSSVDSKTVLEIYRDIYYYKGTLKAVGVTSIEDGRTCGSDEVIIGDFVFKNQKNETDFYNYLGQDIKIYYKDDETEQKTIVCMLPSDSKNETTVIYDNDFNRVIDNGTYYTVEYFDSSGKAKSIKIDRGAVVLKNGVSVETGVFEALKLNHGYITVTASNSENVYGFVSIYDGYDMVIGNINNENSDVVVGTHTNGQWYTMRGEVGDSVIIYDKYDSSLFVDISPDNDKVVVIRNANGTVLGYESLALGDVVTVYKSDDNTHIEIVKGIGGVNGTLDSIDTNKEFYVNDKAYKVTDVCLRNHANEIKAGMDAKFVLNMFGEVAYIESVVNSNIKLAYLADMYYERSLDEELTLKFFTIDGEMKILNAAKIVTVDATKYKKYESVVTKISRDGVNVIPQMVRFGTDAEGKVNYIDLAGIEAGEDDNTLIKSGETSGVYQSPAKKLISMPECIFDSTKTKIMVIPEGLSNGDYIDEAFAIKKLTDLESGYSYSVTAYRVGLHSDYEDVLVIKRDNEWGTAAASALLLVNDVYKGIDDEGDVVDIISAYSTGQNPKKYYIKDSGILKGKNLEKGDLAWFMFGLNGEIIKLESIMYKADGGKQFEGNMVAFSGTNRDSIKSSTSIGAVMCLEHVYAYELSGNVLRYGYELGEINNACYVPQDIYVIDTSNQTPKIHFAAKTEIADYLRAGEACSRVLIRSKTYKANQIFIYK